VPIFGRKAGIASASFKIVSMVLMVCRDLRSKTDHNINVKMFQQDDTFCTVFYSLQTALHVSGETFTHHKELE
jgi:hypothetical protein